MACTARTGFHAGYTALLAVLLGTSVFTADGMIASSDCFAAAASENAIETVVVTARRRVEDEQRVPVAVTALDQKDLDRAQIRQTSDLKFVTPSLNSQAVYGGSNANYTIRGLGNSLLAGSSVTTYFSEVPSAAPTGGAALFDLQSVQVLRGPQGTLFGRATTGGAIVFTPKHPDLENWNGDVDLSFGNYGRSNVTGVVSVPLVEGQLAARVAFHRDHLDGYEHILGSSQTLSGTQSDTLRVGVEWKPSDKFDAYFVFEGRQVNQTPSAEVLVGYNPAFQLFNLPASLSAPLGSIYGPAVFGAVCAQAVGAGFSPNLSQCEDQRLQMLSGYKADLAAELARASAGGNAIRSAPVSPGIPFIEEANTYQFVSNMQYDLGDLGFSKVLLKNNFSYAVGNNQDCVDFDGVKSGIIQDCFYQSGSLGTSSAFMEGNQIIPRLGPLQPTYSEEFQITGSYGDDALVWLLGIYYSALPREKDTTGCWNLNRAFDGVLTPNLGYTCANAMPISGFAWERGLYGNAVFDLSNWVVPGLHFTIGARTTNNYTSSTTAPAIVSLPSGTLVPGPATTQPVLKTSGLGWTLALDYQVNDDVLVYVTSRRGYKPGGLNNIAGSAGAPGFTLAYGPETVVDVELGVKTRFDIMGMPGLFNGNLYRNNYRNIQEALLSRVGATSFAYTENAAAAIVQGIEIETTLIPSESLQITGEYAYNDAHFTKYFAADPLAVAVPGNALCDASVSTSTLCLLDLKNNPFPTATKHQGSLTLRYQLPVEPNAGSLFASITGYIQSRQYWSAVAQRNIQYFGPTLGADNIKDQISQPTYALINARLDWESVYGTSVGASLWVQNLTDKAYSIGGITQMGALGFNTKIYAPPRTFGFDFDYHFGP